MLHSTNLTLEKATRSLRDAAILALRNRSQELDRRCYVHHGNLFCSHADLFDPSTARSDTTRRITRDDDFHQTEKSSWQEIVVPSQSRVRR